MGRQNWRETSSTTRFTVVPSCTPYTLPSGLVVPLATTETVTLTTAITVTPHCYTSPPTPTARRGGGPAADDGDSVKASDLRDPFYASTIPMAYSIAATATLAYVLLLLLFLPNPPNRRPWLQKVATLTVCICLTIAFVETTDVLHAEYDVVGSSVYSLTNEARMVRSRVVAGLVMRIGRVVSDLFLWLAQVQTLIRLFPREREKVIIKWAGFGLILLDTLFSILQSFVSPLASTDSFLDAIPALSYLFQISLSLLYACCVLYYSFAKRRYSYFYPSRPFSPSSPGTKQYGGRSIILVAVLSIASVVTPIVFFIVDIAQKDLAGWGDYIRWVGAASASVVVWEWVDRIEGLEREEGKGGVLGREVYEEDDDDRYTSHRDPPSPPPPGPPASSAPASSTSYAVNMRQLTTTPTISTSAAPSSAYAPAPPSRPTSSDTSSRAPWRPFARRSPTADTPPPRLPVTIIPPPQRGARGSFARVQALRRDGSVSADSARDVPLPESTASGSGSGTDTTDYAVTEHTYAVTDQEHTYPSYTSSPQQYDGTEASGYPATGSAQYGPPPSQGQWLHPAASEDTATAVDFPSPQPLLHAVRSQASSISPSPSPSVSAPPPPPPVPQPAVGLGVALGGETETETETGVRPWRPWKRRKDGAVAARLPVTVVPAPPRHRRRQDV